MSNPKKLIHESHRRSLWRVRPRLTRISLFACACVVAGAWLGCTRETGHAPPEESTITVLQWGDERVFSEFNWDLSPKFLVFLPLTARNERGELEGRLAKSWEHSADFKTWTIHLRSDVKWHDGVPVTAHDMKFTLDLRNHLASLRGGANDTVTVLNDSTYTVTYANLANNPLDWWRVYYPKHLLEHLDPEKVGEWDFWMHPVGNGPYRYVRHVPATLIELEANPDYFRGKPKIDRVILKLGNNASGPLAELQSGNVDAMGVNRATAHNLGEDPRFDTYYMVSAGATISIAWNQAYLPFRDPSVRRALRLAIDRRELHGILDLPDDLPIYDVIMSDRQFRRGDFPEPLPHDPELANRLLEEAGGRDRDGDGIREREGEEFRFTTILQGDEDNRAAVYLQAQLREVGVGMEVQPVATVGEFVRSGDFDAVIFRFFHQLDEGNWTSGRFLGEASPIGFRDPGVASLIASWGRTLDEAELDRIYQALWPILEEQAPMTYLYPDVWSFAAHNRLRGLSSPWRADPVLFMEDLWIEDEP
jgi:peptide/nickel transport system substrate-binding protein